LRATFDVRKTVAGGTSIKRPLRLREMIRALRESEGGAVTIPEEGIVTALGRLAPRGVFAEPTSVTAAVALDRRASGAIATNEKTVAVLTGTGLKAASTVAELLSGASSNVFTVYLGRLSQRRDLHGRPRALRRQRLHRAIAEARWRLAKNT
jgi:threonine synthase